MTSLFKNIITIFFSLLLVLAFTIFAILWTFSNKIPDYKFLKNYKPPVSSKVYSGNGMLVADFSREKRVFVPYETIPKNVINSFLSVLSTTLVSFGCDASIYKFFSINFDCYCELKNVA